MNIFNHLFGGLILFYSIIYVWSKLLNKPINYNSKKFYIVWLLLSLFSITNYFFINKFIKLIILLLIMITFCKILFKDSLKKTIITCIYEQFIVMIAETAYALILSTILGENLEVFLNFALGTLVTNVFVSVFIVFLIQFKFVIKIYNMILKFVEKISYNHFVFMSLFFISAANILAMLTYYKIDFMYLLIFNVTLTLICFVIIICSFKAQSNYNRVSDKYNVAINSLKEYENMMTKYRIFNHENKNLLLTVRAMILNNEKDIPNYIDSMIEEKYEDDEKLLFKMGVIPSGGLRATIYSGILKIKENNIKYLLHIDKGLSTIDLIELEQSTIVDVCKIIGVFIDNSIESVAKLRNKRIQINLYVENNNIVIKVSNNYKDHIDISKIFNPGYTTKGEGHGYGLSLVKEIVEKNEFLINKIEINKKMFSQILSIKYKKSH